MVDRDDALDVGVRVGLVSYGIVHLLLAWLAIQMVFGDREGTVSGGGAFRQLAESDVGRLSLYVVAGGLAALVVWQLAEALRGHRVERGARRAGKRVVSVGRALIYGVLAFAALETALGNGTGDGGTDSLTARLMQQPFGPVLVGLLGAVIVGIAIGFTYVGWTERFLRKLRGGAGSRHESNAYRWFGKAGYLSKAAAFAVIGGLFIYAAWTHDPDKSAGLDQALLQVLEQPLGPLLLGVIAVGIACYGLFCFAWARHLDR